MGFLPVTSQTLLIIPQTAILLSNKASKYIAFKFRLKELFNTF